MIERTRKSNNHAQGRPRWWKCRRSPAEQILMAYLGISWKEVMARYKAVAERMLGP